MHIWRFEGKPPNQGLSTSPWRTRLAADKDAAGIVEAGESDEEIGTLVAVTTRGKG